MTETEGSQKEPEHLEEANRKASFCAWKEPRQGTCKPQLRGGWGLEVLSELTDPDAIQDVEEPDGFLKAGSLCSSFVDENSK